MMNMFRKDVSEVSSRIYIGRIRNTFGKGTRRVNKSCTRDSLICFDDVWLLITSNWSGKHVNIDT